MSGYIQIQVGDKLVGLKFAFPAIQWFTEASKDNIDVYFIGNDFSNEGFAELVFCAYKNNCLIKKVQPELAYENFYNWVEENRETAEGKIKIVEVMQCYTDSSILKDQKKSQNGIAGKEEVKI